MLDVEASNVLRTIHMALPRPGPRP
jgi:hypothetical protein